MECYVTWRSFVRWSPVHLFDSPIIYIAFTPASGRENPLPSHIIFSKGRVLVRLDIGRLIDWLIYKLSQAVGPMRWLTTRYGSACSACFLLLPTPGPDLLKLMMYPKPRKILPWNLRISLPTPVEGFPKTSSVLNRQALISRLAGRLGCFPSSGWIG
jgi:hypothetical protein